MMHDFQANSDFFFEYQHVHLIVAVSVSETFDVAMSGGWDRTLVLHGLTSRQMIQKFDMKYGNVRCLFNLGTAVGVGDKHTVRFLDLETRQIGDSEVKTGGKWINCMNQAIKDNEGSDEIVLLVGGENSNKIDKITIPREIARPSQTSMLRKLTPEEENKMLRKQLETMKTKNSTLKIENEKLKSQLEEKQQENTSTIADFEQKILEVSTTLGIQENLNSKLQQDLHQLKDQLTLTQNQTEALIIQNEINQLKIHNLNSAIDQLNSKILDLRNHKTQLEKKHSEADRNLLYYKSGCENILFIIKVLVDGKVSIDQLLPLVYALPCGLLQEGGIQSR